MATAPEPGGATEPVAIADLTVVSPVRIGLNSEHVAQLVDVLDACPPITVTADGLVVDGAHRLAAAQQLGWQTIPAEVVSIGSPAAVLMAAAEANSAHGLPLTRAERRAAIERLLAYDPSVSDRRLATACGVSRSVVQAARARHDERSGGGSGTLNRREGADGKSYPSVPYSAPGKVAEALVRLDRGLTVRELARRLGVSVGTAHRLRSETLERLSHERALRRMLLRLVSRWRLWRLGVA